MLSFISATFLGTILASANAGRVWRDLEHDVKHLYTYDDFVVEFQKERSAGTSFLPKKGVCARRRAAFSRTLFDDARLPALTACHVSCRAATPA